MVNSGRPLRLVLASQSPRRRELLSQLGLALEVRPAGTDESQRPGELPEDYVRRVAAEKAAAVAAAAVPGALVLGADTAVVLDGAVLGKPADADDAARMLRSLSGRAHLVLTGVCVRAGERVAETVVSTGVTFVPLSEAAIAWYVGTGEPLDKAGAYALQGAGGVFVREVRGSVSNVVGLPLRETAELLRQVGHPLSWEAHP